jgi:hypothetical protein
MMPGRHEADAGRHSADDLHQQFPRRNPLTG